ncbi:ABC transporter substrate-binding protein [Desulfospira joergensenii]|uniref:ABC transporter substrate-binding protein n=1 Tax=Desulfospira joergensenii TaxID=53329 RepID=UPI0003B71802|nr:ABC transporter substrate-binding protein [Desulfospira joergensenii]
MKTKQFLNALVFLFVLCAFTIPVHAGEVYKIGFSGAITGPTSDAGNPLSKGVEDWFKYVNDNKVLGDDKIDCTIRDDQYKTDVTKRNFEEYLDDGIVFYLNYSTGSTLGLKNDFEEEQMPVAPSSYHEGNLVDSNYIFIPVATYSENVVALAEYVVKNHKGSDMPKVAMFIHPSAFGRGPLEDTKKAIASGLKIEIVEVVEHGKDLDNSAMLKRLLSKGVQYVICHTVQSPVATMLKDAMRLGVQAKSFGENGKLTFLGAHYTGGSDLVALAGEAAEGFLWTCSYNLTSENNEKSKKQLALAKTYGRDEKAANSHNYAAGILQAQIPTQAIKMAKAEGLEVTPANLYKMLQKMNGKNAWDSFAAVGPVTYSNMERIGVDVVNIYKVDGGQFKAISSIQSEFMKKVRAKM